jgi:hypothetical protein
MAPLKKVPVCNNWIRFQLWKWISFALLVTREDKAGYIEQHQSPILARLGLDSEQWLTLTTEFEQQFSTAVGSEHMLQQFKHHTDHRRIRGMAKARVLLQHA